MRSLLTTSDRRRLELIELLLEADDWMTFDQVAEQLANSVRNIKEDISYFRKHFPEIGIETGQYRIRIMMDHSIGIQEAYRLILKETLIFQLLEEIFFIETYSIEDLAGVLHTSKSTVYRSIEAINSYFSNVGCQVETNPCRFVGNERFIRNFYRTYFKEKSTILEWPFRHYDEQTLNANINRILAIVEKSGAVKTEDIDFAFYESIKLVIIVNVIRYQNGHLVDTNNEETFLFKLIFNAVKLLFLPKNMSGINGIPITTEYIYQILYPYLKKGNAFSLKELDKLRTRENHIDTALTHLTTSLTALSKVIDIDVDPTSLMIPLYGTVHIEDDDPNGMYILYNRNKMFNQAINHQFPFVYRELYEAMVEFRRLLKLEDNEDKVNYLVYILFTNWENLLLDLYTKYQHTSVLILSDGHYSHANMLKNLLSFELSPNIRIDTYESHLLSQEILDELDYDLIISTFKLPPMTDTFNLVIKHYLSSKDIHRIETVLNRIIKGKNSFDDANNLESPVTTPLKGEL